MARLLNHHRKVAFLFVLPQLVVISIFFIWPALGAVWQSLFYSDAFGIHSTFAGLNNYIDAVLTAEYAYAVWITFVIAFAITFLTLALGLLLALLVSKRQKSQALYKTLLLWPYAIAPAVAAILWRFLCHPTLGLLTQFLENFGIHFNYMEHPNEALLVVILASSWQQFSYNFLFYLGALKVIPPTITEAAIIDGASAWQRLWQIIIPLLSPTTFFLIMMNLTYAFFDTFAVIHNLTNGGPEYATTTLIYKVFQDGFVAMDPGSSSAQSIVLMLVISTLTLVQFRFLEKKVHYQ